MDRTKWNGFVASVITESYSCKLLPGDLYEQLQKHERAGWTKGLHRSKLRNFTHPNLQSIQPDPEFILKQCCPCPDWCQASFYSS